MVLYSYDFFGPCHLESGFGCHTVAWTKPIASGPQGRLCYITSIAVLSYLQDPSSFNEES